MTKWSVSYFKVQSSTETLYANGRMQVSVDVYIKAIDDDTKDRYYLSQDELDSIKLVEYTDTTKEIQDTWTYSSVENEYAHAIGSSSASASASVARAAVQMAAASEQDSSAQCKTYWVQTTRVESKKIAASIVQGTESKTRNTHDGKAFDSYAKLTGKDAVTYTTDRISWYREDTANGKYDYEWQSAGDDQWYTAKNNWDQDNYYVSLTTHPLLHADVYQYDATGRANGFQSDSRLQSCYAYYAEDKKNIKLLFIWPYDGGAEKTETAGLYREATITDWFKQCGRKAKAYTDIKVNQKKDALTLTRLAFDSGDEIWGQFWHYDCGFRVYDIYGNTGAFSAKFSSDRNLVEIQNANPGSDPSTNSSDWKAIKD